MDAMASGREYPRAPLVGVGAVVIRDGEVLLVKRKYEPGKGLWSIPGGLVELGERLRDAVRREILEETGVEVEVGALLDVIDNIVRDEDGRVRFHYVLVDFLAKPLGGSARASGDAEETKWFKRDELRPGELTKTAARLLEKMGFLGG